MSSPKLRVNDSRRPQQVSDLLTLSEACALVGVRPHRIYAAVALGKIHPVQPNGRILYPDWELRALAETVRAVMRTVLNSDFLGIEAA